MSVSDPTDSVPAAEAGAPAAPAAAVPATRRGSRWPWLLLLLAVLGGAGWWQWQRWIAPSSPAADAEAPPSPTLASPAGDELAELRRSLDDAARVNRALREQVLGLTQRVGLVEDGLAGMERGAAPGVDAVRLAEADFLLRLGEEKLRLFGDVGGAKVAFELADAQLAEVSDPRATSVRQTLALERDALAAVAVADLPVLLGRLDGLADAVARWPLRGRETAARGAGEGEPGYWRRALNSLDRYFRVRRVDPAENAAGGPLLRERLALDLSRARLLLLRGEGALALRAIEAVRASVQAEFDASDEGVRRALAILDELRSAPLAPQLPTLGESRRELARLRGVDAPSPSADPAPAPAADPLPGAPLPADAAPQAVPAEAPAADALPTVEEAAPGEEAAPMPDAQPVPSPDAATPDAGTPDSDSPAAPGQPARG